MIYMSIQTGEITFSHEEAVELYRQGHEIALLKWREDIQDHEQVACWYH